MRGTSAPQIPNSSDPNSSNSQLLKFPAPQIPSSSNSQLPEVLPVARRAGGRCAEAGQHVLLDDDPAGVLAATKDLEDAGKRHHAAAEFAEDAAAHRGVIVPVFDARLRRQCWLTVL